MPSKSKLNHNGNDVDSSERESFSDWRTSAIPIDSAVALTAAAAGIISDDEISASSLKTSEPRSPESGTTSETSELSQVMKTKMSD